jgi:hypothetical protein
MAELNEETKHRKKDRHKSTRQPASFMSQLCHKRGVNIYRNKHLPNTATSLNALIRIIKTLLYSLLDSLDSLLTEDKALTQANQKNKKKNAPTYEPTFIGSNSDCINKNNKINFFVLWDSLLIEDEALT